jgi:predicted lactoylglutathione lyase
LEKVVQVTDIRVFIPCKDYKKSQSFYQAMGFNLEPVSDDLSIFNKGSCTFFLQRIFNQELANNRMLHLIVPDIQ